MTLGPANISDCTAPVNSSRAITSAVLTLEAAYLATYDPPVAHTVTMAASLSATWGRSTFPRDGAEKPPGDGQFYVAQDCCCQCRARFVFGDQTYTGEPANAGDPVTPYTLTRTDQELDDDGNPTGDPETTEFPRLLSLRMWTRADAPCRAPDGPQRAPNAFLYLPSELFHVAGEDGTETEAVTGSYGIRRDTGLAPIVDGYDAFIFETPDPCSNAQDFECQVVKSWNIIGALTATSTTTVSFSMS